LIEIKLGYVFVISIVAVFIILHNWSKINQNQKKEKWTFVTLTMAGWLLSVLLVYFPDIPGPSNLIDKLFKPLATLLE
jgi:uncharacterized membrane protein YbhN (UPF0104 family)